MGVDVMRWLYCDHIPEKDLFFGFHRADDVRRHFLLPLWNIYSFFVTYANIDGWKPDAKKPLISSQLDLWILSRLNEVVAEVTLQLESYEPNRATAEVARFLDHLGNWYLRRSRRRFWAKAGASEASDADKHAAYTTLYHVLVEISRLLAPFVPFVTEEMHQNLVRTLDSQAHKSVHHCKWPQVDPETEDPDLIAEMALVMRLVSLGHAARNKANRKLRQPLQEAAFVVGTASERDVVNRYADLIRDELNVKDVRLLDTAVEVVDYQLKPLPKQLGQKYGSRFPGLRDAILELKPQTAAARLQKGESIDVELEGDSIQILPEEVEIRMDAHEGFSAASEGLYLAALVTELTTELELEGFAREFVRRVQELRKTADLKVDERIDLLYRATDRLTEAVNSHRAYIVGETLTLRLEEVDQPSGLASSKHTFNGEELEIALQRSAT